MTTRVVIRAAGLPQPGGSKRSFRHQHTGKVVVMDDNPRSKDWKRTVGWAAREAMAGEPMLLGPLRISFVFHVPRPKGHASKRGGLVPSAPRYPAVKPDVLKLARSTEDALTCIVYRDDAQIVEEHLTKSYSDAFIGVVITVEALT